jgi:hypothetical protein
MSGAAWAATKAGACTDLRARPWSRRSPPALRWQVHERMTALHAGALIATSIALACTLRRVRR